MSEFCKKVDELTEGVRKAAYGPPTSNFKITAEVMAGLGFKFQQADGGIAPIAMEHIPIIMMCLKLARLANHPDCYHYDSLIDMAGYAKCAETIHLAKVSHGPVNTSGSDSWQDHIAMGAGLRATKP